jgi:ElaA protein
MTISWANKSFAELTLIELYEILALRQKVFMIEQQDIYLDADGKDINAIHLIAYSDGDEDLEKKIIAYARIILPDAKNNLETTSFGRVIVDKNHRGTGLAKNLIQQVLGYLRNSIYAKYPIKISAQAYLINFYKKFGFETVGEIYLDGTIEHIDMIKIS